MGCDIHLSVEWRRREANQTSSEWWIGVFDAGFLPRDYPMFGCMVDGHSRGGDIKGVAPERGLPPLPSDIASEVAWYREHANDRDAYLANAVCSADHTFSWLTPSEYRDAIALREKEGYPADAEYHALAAYVTYLETCGAVRIVFGFDY